MNIVEVLKAILFGIIEGITEWLPISSTGHMILLEEFIKLDVTEEFFSLFLVFIQLGAIFAVCILYFTRLNPFSKEKDEIEKKETWQTWLKVLIACIPCGIVGILFDDWIDAKLSNFITVSIMLIVYGILFIVIEIVNKNKEIKAEEVKNITYKTAFIIGMVQVLSLIPGTSRSGVTILGAMILGCSRKSSCEFTFFLSIPAMLGACLIRGLKYFLDYGMPSLSNIALLGIGMIIAFIVSIFVIKFLISYIKEKDFKVFGIYRIGLGIVLLSYFLIFVL